MDAEVFLEPLVDGVDDTLVSVPVHIGQASYSLSVRENNRPYMRVVQDAVRIPPELVIGGGDVHLGRAGQQLAADGGRRERPAAKHQRGAGDNDEYDSSIHFLFSKLQLSRKLYISVVQM